MASLEPAATDGRGLVGLDGCEVRLCGLCAFVRPRVPCVSCVSRLPPVSFYRYTPPGVFLPVQAAELPTAMANVISSKFGNRLRIVSIARSSALQL